MLVFQSILFVLAVVKSIQVAAAEYNTPKVMVVLLRDSAAYFGTILAILVVDITIWAAGRVCYTHHVLRSSRHHANAASNQSTLFAVAIGYVSNVS